MKQSEGKGRRAVRIALAALSVTIAVLAALALFNAGRIQRLYHAMTLFDSPGIVENFRNMGALFGAREIRKGPDVYQFKRKKAELPQEYVYKGKKKKVKDFIDRTGTTGLIVIRDDTILYEKYYRGNSDKTLAISWSVVKSIVSALFGIAAEEGRKIDIQKPADTYVPSLAASGYRGVRIKDILQMSSGIRFNEDYGDFNSDINRMGRVFALNTPLKDFIMTLRRNRTPGTYNHYVSMDTQVLGMIICAVTGKNLSHFAEEKLWKPLGMESDALWLVDSAGMEVAFGGLNAVLRDYARFGRLYLNNGNWNGRQIVPAAWVKASITPDAPHLMPGKKGAGEFAMGYGYQWWIPENPQGDFCAIGIYGQAIYVNPTYRIVIAKTSAYADYNKDGDEMEYESVEMFRAVAKNVREQ